MATAVSYGGWFSDRPASTGASLGMTRAVRWLATTMLASVGTAGAIDVEFWQRHQSGNITSSALKIPTVEATPLRTPAEDLAQVRQILSPAVSDLANALGVSRQAVYNWMNGEQPKPEHAAKLRDLAQAADLLAEVGIPVTSAVLKRKVIDGRNLFEVAQAGGSARDAAQRLAHILRRETQQRERMATRFAGRKVTSRSVESDFPAANDVS